MPGLPYFALTFRIEFLVSVFCSVLPLAIYSRLFFFFPIYFEKGAVGGEIFRFRNHPMKRGWKGVEVGSEEVWRGGGVEIRYKLTLN